MVSDLPQPDLQLEINLLIINFFLTSEFDPALKLPETLTPVWFNEDKTTSWDASGQYSGTENEKCSIEVQGGKWKYILKIQI